jgi:acyl phosphate:glycerol-3-phosphate acyltransferase
MSGNEILARVIAVAIGYVCGLFLTGFFYSKSKNVDIRTMGSKNAGTTNTLRVLGFKAGAVTFAGDVLKTAVAIVLVRLLFGSGFLGCTQITKVLELYAGLGAILGHNFPFYMHFKGGKGIACTAGILLFFCPFEAPISIGLFLIVLALTRYVSLGSILLVISFFIQTVIFGNLGWFGESEAAIMEIDILAAIIMVMGIVRHKANIGRLLSGTENKFSIKVKKQ